MNISTLTLGTRRRTGAGSGAAEMEENAGELKLGPEFALRQLSHSGEETPLTALNLLEAKILIRVALRSRRSGGDGEEEDGDLQEEELVGTLAAASDVLKKTAHYINAFARFKDELAVAAVEDLLRRYTDVNGNKQEFHPFERAQLGTLVCDDADEAKTLIPSLADKISDQELQGILNQLTRLEARY